MGVVLEVGQGLVAVTCPGAGEVQVAVGGEDGLHVAGVEFAERVASQSSR
jgi:hypothetical protein